jgi:anti-sigma regulatory factor (Ser/Thr protein kinase)
VVADVAGHNLDAAYLSAYFHGMVHGMVHGNLGPPAIIDDLNGFLLDKWNDRDLGDSLNAAPEASVCTLFIEVEPAGGRFIYHNNGIPAPLLTLAEGESRRLGEGNAPLGLYEDPETEQGVVECPEGGSIMAWSDGLESFALAQRISPEAAAYRILATGDAEREVLLAEADDDTLVVRVQARGPGPCPWHPVIFERYPGNSAIDVDSIEDCWSRSLQFALPELPEDKLYALLLTAREALLNALNHGCKGNPDLIASMHVHYAPRLRTLRLMISDPGPGHSDTFLTDPEPDLTQERHSGLVLIRNFPDRVWTTRNNASVHADFTWS